MSSSPRRAEASPPARGHRALWISAFAAVAALLVARNLIGLGSTPVGAYVDETSIGYNAWTISAFGVDEHGAHLPLYFAAFGEFKNPVYIYTLSALLRVLPLTVTTERLPAALFGLLTCLFLTLLAWRRTRSRPLTLFILGLAALTPWLTVESRVGFEVVSMLAAVSGALLCLSLAIDTGRLRWYLATGFGLAVAVYAYSTGRVAVLLFAIALAIGLRGAVGRDRRWMALLLPIALAYGLLLAWNLAHPGALTARFDAISIGADGAPLGTVALRFVTNYATYFGPDFLFVSGDGNPRHATQFGGELPWVMLPLLLIGVWYAWRHRHDPYIRVLLLFLVLAPVSAALTNEGVPHSLRASVMVPLLVAVCIEGAAAVRSHLSSRPVITGFAIVALLVQGLLFTGDMFGAWPARSAVAFDAGEIDAITRAAAMSHGHPVLLSDTLDPPYISAAFALRPPPPATTRVDSETALLSAMNMVSVDPQTLTAPPGALAVLAAGDPAPQGAQVLFSEVTPLSTTPFGPPPLQSTTIIVYRLP